jgi:hypothetical protein
MPLPEASGYRPSELLGSFGRWFHHRGLAPHQITPMLGVHKPSARRPSRGYL